MFRYSFSIIFLLFSLLSFSQIDKQKELEQQKVQIQKQLRNFQELLEAEKSKEKSTLDKIQEKQTKIRLTEKLIKTTKQQEALLAKDIAKNEKELKALAKELEALKADYAQMIIRSYETRSEQSRLMFILSSENFLQAYKRIQYMKQYADFRKEQGEEVKQKSLVLEEKNRVLEKQKAEKEKLIKETEKEYLVLEAEKKLQDALMALIGKNKRKYLSDIKKKQQEISEIDRKIEKIKREIIAEANRKKALAEGKKVDEKNISSTTFDLSPEGKLIAGNFKANQGKLPWPVERGTVHSRFGRQKSTIVGTLDVDNKWVDFKTTEGADAQAVFEGEVSQIMVHTPTYILVFVRHGDYLTVYGSLDKIYVKKGQKVNLKQKLGRVHTGSAGTILRFSIGQNTTTLNPEQWIYGL
ncbi:MAG: peptidoglycan DD-metalloendopeptidase family protein [Flavobacteriaceae bacterium]